jgi:hypothetical protein
MKYRLSGVCRFAAGLILGLLRGAEVLLEGGRDGYCDRSSVYAPGTLSYNSPDSRSFAREVGGFAVVGLSQALGCYPNLTL